MALSKAAFYLLAGFSVVTCSAMAILWVRCYAAPAELVRRGSIPGLGCRFVDYRVYSMEGRIGVYASRSHITDSDGRLVDFVQSEQTADWKVGSAPDADGPVAPSDLPHGSRGFTFVYTVSPELVPARFESRGPWQPRVRPWIETEEVWCVTAPHWFLAALSWLPAMTVLICRRGFCRRGRTAGFPPLMTTSPSRRASG